MNAISFLIEAIVIFSVGMAGFVLLQSVLPKLKEWPVALAPALSLVVTVVLVAHSVAIQWRTKTLVEQGAGLVVGNVQALLGGATQQQQQQLAQAQAQAAQQQTQQQQGGQQQQVDPAVQARAQVLKILETVLADPENVNPEELRGRVQDQFKQVMKTADDRKTYRREIIAAYECQKEFLQDALNSLRSKQALKSKDRAECETRSGSFFLREKLVAPDQAAANDQVVVQLAKGEKIPNPSKNNAPWDEDSLRSAVYLQQKRIDAVRVILR